MIALLALMDVPAGPPAVSDICLLFNDSLFKFIGLVHDYLPGKEREFDNLNSRQKAALFLKLFHDKYKFQLVDIEPSIQNIVEGIPVFFQGIEFDCWHAFGRYCDTVQLVMLITSPPEFYDEGDLKAALYEVWEAKLGKDILLKIPAVKAEVGCHIGGVREASTRGWEPDVVRRLLKGTQYEGAADWAEYITWSTGLCQMDRPHQDYEECGEEIEWERVDGFASEWPQVEAMDKRMEAFRKWIEGDTSRFTELVDFILMQEKKKPVGKKLMEILEEEI